MQKVISICLLFVMLLSVFAGCSKTQKLSKDEMLSQAEKVTSEDINSDSRKNPVSAKEKYCNKVLLIEGYIWEIEEDHIVLSTRYYGKYNTSVYLPKEEIVKLEDGQQIVVVGKTSDELVEKPDSDGYPFYFYQMQNAYLVKDN